LMFCRRPSGMSNMNFFPRNSGQSTHNGLM
jgi:hypothetical protein